MMRSVRFKLASQISLFAFLALGSGLLPLAGCSDDTISDPHPPAAITDLAAAAAGPGSVRLTWTAPGDDGNQGQAFRYRAVMATNAHSLDIVSFCAPAILTLPDKTPRPAGQPETLVVNNLVPGQTYSFRVQTEDKALNSSPSNQATQLLPESVPPQAHWQFLGDAFDGVVLRLAAIGSDLIAVGPFTKVGAVTASRVARWDGGAWQPMDQGLPAVQAGADTGITGLTLRAVTSFGDRPAVCGGLTRRSGGSSKSFIYVAIWNGASWDSLRTRATGDVYDLISYDNSLIVAGTFTRIDSLADVGGIARWNGTQWSRVGPAGTFRNPAFTSLATDGGALIAAGAFDSTATVRSKRVAAWNGSSWSAWGAGDPPGSIFTTTLFNGRLILGGNFGVRQMAAGGAADTVAGNVRKVNCSTTSANALLALPGQLLVGGNFNLAGTVPTLSLATWNGTTWGVFGRHENIGVSALTLYNQQVTVSSAFAPDGAGPLSIRVATWTP